jgi:hypothetical protein
MVYVVQNYLAFLDSIHRLVCGSFTKDHNVSVTGSVSVLRWMEQDKPTQLGPSEGASLNHWTETLWYFVKLPHTRWWIQSKRSQIVLYCVQFFISYSLFFYMSNSECKSHNYAILFYVGINFLLKTLILKQFSSVTWVTRFHIFKSNIEL